LARYFKFRTLDELAAESRQLGLGLRFQEDFAPLFRPVPIGPLRAGNALCVQPMEGCDGTPDGRPGELTVRRYRRFGAGGAKLIWGEATAVLPEARATPRQLLLSAETAADIGQLAAECRRAHREAFGPDDDLVIGLQLTHSGRYSHPRPLIALHDPLLDPRTVADRGTGRLVDGSYPVLDDDYLRRLVDAYVGAARLAWQVGFQFVDVKQCHRYLLNELLAAKTRPGPFGGSFENRTRLARDVITAIRAEVPGLVIASRLSVYDGIPYREGADGVGVPVVWSAPVRSAWGTAEDDPARPDLAEPIAWVGEMARLGVALVNVTLGNPYASPHLLRPFEYPPPDGYETPEHPLAGVDRHVTLAARLQHAFPDLPMVGSGYSYLQEFLFHAGAANVADGRVRLVGVGRASLPQPDFARRLLEDGRLDRRRVCRTFSYCTALMRAKQVCQRLPAVRQGGLRTHLAASQGQAMNLAELYALRRPGRKVRGIAAMLLPFTASGTVAEDAYAVCLRETAAAGLTPAVNMDTGYVNLLSRAERAHVLRLARAALGGAPFVAGAYIDDQEGDVADLYRREAAQVAEHGGTPILFQTARLHGAPAARVIDTYARAVAGLATAYAFELGPVFAPSGEIWPAETVAGLMQVPELKGLKHSSLDRLLELERLALRDRVRPEFEIFTGNDLGIDMIEYGSQYLLGLAAFAPGKFAERDRLWEAQDPGYFAVADALQYLGDVAFRPPVPAYKHSAAVFLHLLGKIPSDRPHPRAPRRPAWEREMLQACAARLEL
jgi:2,4-dienoyl-CoA reductase-like NADH-dependent reductase (Old Yellow Enzyme family)/dihydrodipicolinate synthase/N-acetylneuraminate lyase